MKTSSILNVFAAFILCGILIISCGKSTVEPPPVDTDANDRSLPYDFSNWMAKIDDSKYLSEITIPGTHDSGADLHTSLQGSEWVPYVICQHYRLSNQLRIGVRWFDIRLRLHDGTFFVHHSDFYLHKNIDDMIQPALDFLKSNPTEVVVFMIKQEHSNESDWTFLNALFQKIYNSYDLNSFYWSNRVPTIGEVRGKIVIVRRFGPVMDNFWMHFDWDDNTWGANFSTEGVDIYVQDAYQDISYDDKKRIIYDCIKYANEETNRQKFHLNFTSCEKDKDLISLLTVASNINPGVSSTLLSNPLWHKSGVIMVNFAGGSDYGEVSSDLVKLIINQNDFTETVTIGSQVWMKKNLNVSYYRNGDAIPQVTDNMQWQYLTTGAWCYYNNDPATGEIYGKLYNWYAVNDPRGLAPAGWHVPANAEWTTLVNYLGGESVAGSKMKETGTTHWTSPNFGATNESGFTALPGGRRYDDGNFIDVGDYGYWWSSNEYGTDWAWFWHMGFNGSYAYSDSFPKVMGYSVRCLRD